MLIHYPGNCYIHNYDLLHYVSRVLYMFVASIVICCSVNVNHSNAAFEELCFLYVTCLYPMQDVGCWPAITEDSP